ncbi:MAG: flagellar hook-associated protein 2, partial [Planctomycetota bacterium]
DVIDGISIDLLSSDAGAEAIFTVEPDKEAIKIRVRDFIAAYNEVVEFVNNQNTYDEEGGAKGDLFGDSLLRTIRSTISSALLNVDSDVVANDQEGYSTMSLVGIEQENDGKLKINGSTFDDKVTENISAFADLFVDYDGFDNGGAEPNTPDFFTDTTADSGLMATLEREIERLFDSQDGPTDGAGDRSVIRSPFDTRKATINSQIDRYEDQIEARERRIETYREGLVRQFSNLDSIMSNLQSQSNFLNF